MNRAEFRFWSEKTIQEDETLSKYLRCLMWHKREQRQRGACAEVGGRGVVFGCSQKAMLIE